MATATINGTVSSETLSDGVGLVAPKAKMSWVQLAILVTLYGTAFGLPLFGVYALFLTSTSAMPFALSGIGFGYATYATIPCYRFLCGWGTRVGLLYAVSRFVVACFTATCLVAGLAYPRAWMVGITGIAIAFVFRALCGPGGETKVQDLESGWKNI